MNFSDEGPEGPESKKYKLYSKLDIIPPNDLCLFGLHRTLWFELILKRLLLVDLIFVKRTCKIFATHKLLKRWIKMKQYEAFGEENIRRNEIPKMFWNHFDDYFPNYVDVQHVFRDNKGRFILYTRLPPSGEYKSFLKKQGIFSSKRLLWNAFQSLDWNTPTIYTVNYMVENVAQIILKYPGGVIGYIDVKGINKEIEEWLELKGFEG